MGMSIKQTVSMPESLLGLLLLKYCLYHSRKFIKIDSPTGIFIAPLDEKLYLGGIQPTSRSNPILHFLNRYLSVPILI